MMAMRVVTPSEAGITVRERATRTARFELLGLAAATIVTAVGAALTIAARPSPEYRAALGLPLAAFFAVYWAAHLFRRWRGAADDPVLLPTVHLLTGIGLMTMIALADPLRDSLLAPRFAWGTVLGVAALVGAASIDLEPSPLRRMVALPLAIALTLAALLLVFGRGPGSSGVKVNLLGVQPVEAIRLLVILALAAFFARRIEFLRELSRFGLPRSKDVRPVLVAMALVLGFFFLQKDLGPALVLTFVFLGLYGVARGRVAFVIVGVLLLALAFAVAYRFGFPPTVRLRVAIWLDPWNNGLVRGDQIAKGFWAMATGGITGTGTGLGDPQLVPAGHTDFVFAAIGEELGFAGLFAVVVLYVLLCWRCLRAALRAPGDYTALLAIGIALGLLVQAFVITGGVLGLLPLSGVVTPFLSYGRSSMIANCAAVGMVLGIAARAGEVRTHMTVPVRTLAAVLVAAGAVVLGRVAWIQIIEKDGVALAASLTQQGDGALRFQYNPRLVAAARTIERGTIFDRNGLPLATSRAAEIQALTNRYAAAGIRPLDACAADTPRCYPLGGVAFHLLGDEISETNWAASNASFLERDSDARLKGWNDHPQRVDVRNPRTGAVAQTVRRDYHELLPLLRARYEPGDSAVAALLARNRDVRSSIDARLQIRTAALLEQHIRRGGFTRGAAVILDVASGEVLAAASYPWPDATDLSPDLDRIDRSERADRLLDRARYGLYPPGSTFKLLVAAAALRCGTSETFACVRLPDGRVGNYVAGSSRPIRDDPMDTVPHGTVDLHRGLIVSCNAYFAQLAVRMGPKPLLDAASLFQIEMAKPSTPAQLRQSLAYAGYGQGEVVVSPVKMARIAATIARQGRVVQARWLHDDTPAHDDEPRLLSASDASVLARDMRAVVVSGTGRVLASNATAIAGKTGTAEVANGRSHSWFAGFAPYGGSAPRRIAFAVIIENGGYGGRAAAPLAGDLVSAARELGLFR